MRAILLLLAGDFYVQSPNFKSKLLKRSVMIKLYLVILFIEILHPSFGKIKNGYEDRIESSRISLQNLNMYLRGDSGLSSTEKSLLKVKIKVLVDHISYYELTDEFIRQFKIVAPIMFTELDNIKDKKGRNTDVFIRLVPETHSRTPMVAATFFQRMLQDDDASFSSYGPFSVSVDIIIVENALELLSHELGHISYIVPNLAEYSKFYNLKYRNSITDKTMGHSPGDASGRYSHIFERRFIEERKNYFRNGGKKPMSLFPLLVQIKRNTKNPQNDYPLLFALND